MEKLRTSEGVVIALVTAALYAFCYSYEAGYLSYYNVPASFISLSITAIIPALMNGILYITFIVAWLSACIYGMESKYHSSRLFSGIAFIAWIYLAAYYLNKGVIFITFAIYSVLIFIATKTILEYIEKRARKFRAYAYIIDRKFLRTDNRKKSSLAWSSLQNFFTLLLIIIGPMFLAYSAGKTSAASKTSHATIQNLEFGKSRIIRKYGTTVIMHPINTDNKKTSYYIESMDSISGKLITPTKTTE